MIHIGLVIWSPHITGGLQKVGFALVNAMIARGHAVTVFYRRRRGQTLQPPAELHADAVLCPLDLDRSVCLSPEGPAYLKQARERLVSSGIDVLAALFSWDSLLFFPYLLRGTDIPLLVSEHNNPTIINTERWNAYERHACLTAADGIHTLLQSFVPMYPEFLRERITVIPNPVAVESLSPPSRVVRADGFRLLAAGRFVDAMKQFSLLLEAFASLAESFPGWRLTLCGDGPDAKLYRKLIARYGLEERIKLPGVVADMPSLYKDSDLVCVPSRYEGFSLVAVEAGAFSLPVVGFAGCSGVNEVVVHSENGLLAPEMTAPALAERLAALMADEQSRRRMGERGRELCVRFLPETVFDQWEALLRETAQRKGHTRLQALSAPASGEDASVTALREILGRSSPFARPFGLKIVLRLQTLKTRAAGFFAASSHFLSGRQP